MSGKSSTSRKATTEGPARKRARTNFTAQQLNVMEQVFSETQYPDVTVLEKLSESMGLEVEKVCTWFQNRRSKFRKESKKGHIMWMRHQFYSKSSSERNRSENKVKAEGASAPVTIKKDLNIDSVLTRVPSPDELHNDLTMMKYKKPSSNMHYYPQSQPNNAVRVDDNTSSSSLYNAYPTLPFIQPEMQPIHHQTALHHQPQHQMSDYNMKTRHHYTHTWQMTQNASNQPGHSYQIDASIYPINSQPSSQTFYNGHYDNNSSFGLHAL